MVLHGIAFDKVLDRICENCFVLVKCRNISDIEDFNIGFYNGKAIVIGVGKKGGFFGADERKCKSIKPSECELLAVINNKDYRKYLKETGKNEFCAKMHEYYRISNNCDDITLLLLTAMTFNRIESYLEADKAKSAAYSAMYSE